MSVRLTNWAALLARSESTKDSELLVLRPEVAVLLDAAWRSELQAVATLKPLPADWSKT